MSTHRIIFGDCREVLPELPEESVDLVVTSPPYAQGKEYEQGLDYDGLWALMEGVAPRLLRVTRKGGFAFVNFGDTTKYPRSMCELYTNVFREAGWGRVHSRRVWKKSFARIAQHNAAIYTSVMTMPFAEYELIWTWRRPGGSKEAIRARQLHIRAVWDTTNDRDHGRDLHPAGFPICLPEKAIKVWSDEGALVLDPFMGGASTVMAARALGRNSIGIELHRDYEEVIRERLGHGQPQLPGVDADEVTFEHHESAKRLPCT